MSRRHEPRRSVLPPEESDQAELAQPKAFEDREEQGPPAVDYVLLPDGTAEADNQPGDATTANETTW